jgi:hypothetical protein
VGARLATAYAELVEQQLGVMLGDHGCAVQIIAGRECEYLVVPDDGYLVMSEGVRCGRHADV